MTRAETMRWAGEGIALAWAFWLLGWALAGLRTKPVLRRESHASTLIHAAPLLLGMALLLVDGNSRPGRVLAAWPATAWLFHRFIAPWPGLVLIGAPLVLAGLAVTLWARLHLGGNWSGSVTLKQSHSLIRSGPYRLARHPIYTGLLIAIAGTGFATGEGRGVAGFALILLAFRIKSRIEERVMLAHFGEAYRRYQAEVKALVPFLF
ncbi:MAG: isoprenylcysteine carboxylmethyltransferase family protein [Rhodospirillales bacterium]|nr:isoprenylcysteine carboxylmethyltransferase family protein [Rhodospirillales bacterium]